MRGCAVGYVGSVPSSSTSGPPGSPLPLPLPLPSPPPLPVPSAPGSVVRLARISHRATEGRHPQEECERERVVPSHVRRSSNPGQTARCGHCPTLRVVADAQPTSQRRLSSVRAPGDRDRCEPGYSCLGRLPDGKDLHSNVIRGASSSENFVWSRSRSRRALPTRSPWPGVDDIWTRQTRRSDETGYGPRLYKRWGPRAVRNASTLDLPHLDPVRSARDRPGCVRLPGAGAVDGLRAAGGLRDADRDQPRHHAERREPRQVGAAAAEPARSPSSSHRSGPRSRSTRSCCRSACC